MHHFHFHIHALIHYIRHARMIGSYLRFTGMMLLTLVLGLLQFDSFGAVSLASAKERESRCFTACSVGHDAATTQRTTADPAKHPVSPHALHQSTYSGVFHRLRPRIMMIPRMNRTPKPKSVYRNFARAPGVFSFVG